MAPRIHPGSAGSAGSTQTVLVSLSCICSACLLIHSPPYYCLVTPPPPPPSPRLPIASSTASSTASSRSVSGIIFLSSRRTNKSCNGTDRCSRAFHWTIFATSPHRLSIRGGRRVVGLQGLTHRRAWSSLSDDRRRTCCAPHRKHQHQHPHQDTDGSPPLRSLSPGQKRRRRRRSCATLSRCLFSGKLCETAPVGHPHNRNVHESCWSVDTKTIINDPK